MSGRSASGISFLAMVLIISSAAGLFADDAFDKLISSGKYKEAVDYADNSIPPAGRNADVWVKLGEANEAIGLTEKALACYLVSWRLNPSDYKSQLGAAKIYNKLGQSENALNMAKKALEVSFTADASWEYARACIALNRAPEAKKALEKVMESDPGNPTANKELGAIYYNDKQYDKAIPLLKKSFQSKKDGEVALKIGQCYRETGNADSAMAYYKQAVDMGVRRPEVILDLARIYIDKGNYESASDAYDKAAGAAGFGAKDFYNLATAREKTGNQKASVEAYQRAVALYGTAKDKEALNARYRIAAFMMQAKNYAQALPHLQFISTVEKTVQTYPDLFFQLSDAYLGVKDLPRAIAALEKAIASSAKNIEAYARLADLYEKSGNALKAKQTYETMMALSPGDPHVYLVLADYSLKSGKFQEALTLYGKADSLNPTAETKQGIAICAASLNQWGRAQQAANAAIGKDPSLLESRKILAEVYMRSKEYQDARDHLESLTQRDPSNRKYWDQLAECYEGLKDVENMAKVDKKLIQLDSKIIGPRLRLARYSLSKNDPKESGRYFEMVLALDPKNVEALKNLFTFAKAQGRKPEAINYGKGYLALNPGDAEVQRDLGDLLFDQKDFDGALAGYRAALKTDPQIKGFYKRYAEIVLKKGLQEEVIRALRELIKTGEADMSTYTTLGMIYEQQKQYKSALDVYQKALALEPQNGEILAALGSCQAIMGDINGAIISYEQSVMMNQKSGKGFKALGDLYMKQGRKDEAVKAYMNYLDKVPGDTLVAKSVGRAAFDKKQYKEAIKYLGLVRKAGSQDQGVLFGYGAASYYETKYDSAVTVLGAISSRTATVNTKEIKRMLAESYEKLGKGLEAAKAYGEFAALSNGTEPEAAYKSAALQEQANPSVALKIYESNTKAYPRDYRNFLKLGKLFAQNKTTLTQSAAMLKAASLLADSIPAVWFEMGTVYGKLGREEDELNAYRQYVKLDPRNVQANKRIGIILESKGKVQDGMVYLETANALNPDDADVIVALADGYLKTNRKQEAVDRLTKVKSLKSGNLDVRFKLYELYRDLNKLGPAEKEISELIALKRDNKYLCAYADVLVAQGKFKEAGNTVEDILATDPENKDMLMLKGEVLRSQKKFDDAIEVYKEISTIDPEDASALYERAETYVQQAKVNWARTFYERALKTNPRFARAELGLAKLEKQMKNDKGYRDHLEAAIKIDPTDKDVLEEVNRMKK